MSRGPRPRGVVWVLPAAVAACLMAAVVATVLLVGQVSPRFGGRTPEFAAGLSLTGLERQGVAQAGRGDYAAAERDARRVLRGAPSRTAAWCLVAYARTARFGAPDAAALDAFRASYRVAPLDPDLNLWRIRFGLDNWSRLDPPLRARVSTEMTAFCTRGARARRTLQDLADAVSDPAGRLAARLHQGTCAAQATLAAS